MSDPLRVEVTWDNPDRELRLMQACVELFTRDAQESNDGEHEQRAARVSEYLKARYGWIRG